MLDDKGYVRDVLNNLIDGVQLGDFEEDLRQGDGNELEGKFRAAHSSSALAVNAFAPFRRHTPALHLLGMSDFVHLSFERKCHHGLRGRRSPNLDAVAEGPSGVIGIESKCLEPLVPHVAKFAPAYAREIVDERRESTWFKEMERLVDAPRSYRWLDAAQLVKHAFGLAYTFKNRPVTLLYLFWEPTNPEAHPVFAEHRAEISGFAAAIGRNARPGFTSMSYPELWASWSAQPEPWLRQHVARLQARYSVAV